MKARTSIFEQFMLLFEEVKRHSGGEPTRIKVFYKEHNELRRAVDALYTFMMRTDFERRVFHGKKKYHSSVPREFSKLYQEYTDKWNDAVASAWLDLSALEELLEEQLGSQLDEFVEQSDPGSSESISADWYEKPDPEHESSFDPLRHDGGKSVDMAFWATRSYADEPDESMDTIHAASRIGLEAVDYLYETIGLNPDDVFRRWRSMPTIFMPAHVSNMHGSEERGSLFELLDDATRAFVFGAPAASIAACRAALEMVLKQHYRLDHTFKDKKGRTRDKRLGELIILADKKYEFVQGRRLQGLSDGANAIMHSYSRTKPLTTDDERVILEFFKTLKFLIERAPDR